jgi:FkbM family methyltransferase
VFTFEPEPASFRALTKNTYTTRNITAFHSALGSITGYARMRPTMTAGTWRVANEETIDPERTEHIRQVGPWALDKDGKVEVVMTTIDDANPIHCDAIVLDVEGHEVEVLKGAAKTIAKHHPIIHVEELPRSAEDIRWHMQSLNYRLAREHGADRIYEYKGGRQ